MWHRAPYVAQTVLHSWEHYSSTGFRGGFYNPSSDVLYAAGPSSYPVHPMWYHIQAPRMDRGGGASGEQAHYS